MTFKYAVNILVFISYEPQITRKMEFRFLVLWTTLSILFLLTPYTKGQSSTNAANTSTIMSMEQSISPSESTSRWPVTSSVPQTPSAAVTSSTHSISPAVTSQPTVTSQPHSQSSLTSEQNVTATTKPGSTEGPKLGQTEWMLIACLGAFAIVLITLVILVIQMSRLNQTVTRLKDASHR